MLAGGAAVYYRLMPGVQQQLNGIDSEFAEAVFKDLPYDHIAVSYGGGPQDLPVVGCSVAVVVLHDIPSATPPRLNITQPKGFQFGGLWRKTPLPLTVPHFRDLLEVRGASIEMTVLRFLREEMALPGAFAIRSWTGDELQIYAPESVVAARLRHGAPAKLRP